MTHSPAWEMSAPTAPEVGRTLTVPYLGRVDGASVRLVAWRLCPGSWDRQTIYEHGNTS